VCVAFLCNEVISILENAGLMGVPLPAALKNAVELLQKKDK
jgi:phage-related holin